VLGRSVVQLYNRIPPPPAARWATTGAVTAKPYLANSCISGRDRTAQLVARGLRRNGPANQTNISCLAGPSAVERGRAKRPHHHDLAGRQHRPERRGPRQTSPGSVLISANISKRSQLGGLLLHLSRQPSITLTTPGFKTANSGGGQPETTRQSPIVATAFRPLMEVPLTGLSLEFGLPPRPPPFPAGSTVTAAPWPAAGPPSPRLCQPAQLQSPRRTTRSGLLGNGKPVTSNSVKYLRSRHQQQPSLYMASTQSQYMVQIDFPPPPCWGQPFLLPYVPQLHGSISNDGFNIYMGSFDGA